MAKEKKVETNNNMVPYLWVILALFGLVFLGSTYFFSKVAIGDSLLQLEDESVAIASPKEIAPKQNVVDPLITVVPDEQISSESKTKIFISSLDPKLGYDDSKVFVIIYGKHTDVEAQAYVNMANEIVAKYSNEVMFVWKDYVTADDERAYQMAEISHCAEEQRLFWEFAVALTDRTADDDVALYQLLTDVGGSRTSAEECISTSGYQGLIDQSYYAGQNLGITNSHTLFINDRMYTEVLSQDQLTAIIDEILATY
ncbi:MAG: thioredoxin domain-containing protein [bacterium]|nr:thioredoxin domain-containing protein [bacterium]